MPETTAGVRHFADKAMKYRGAVLRGAHVEPLACIVLLKVLEMPEVAPHLSAYLRGLSARAGQDSHPVIDQIDAALNEMRAAQREYTRSRAELDGSDVGTAEPARVEDAGGSVSPPQGHLTVTEVAERLGVSSEYVRRLCRDRVLSATRTGRAWSIEITSVVEHEARSTAA